MKHLDVIVQRSDGGLAPGLARSWSYAGTGNTTFVIHLRPGVKFSDGSSQTELVRVSKGNPQLPLTDDELRAKFADAASLAAGPDRIAALISAIEQVDALPQAGDLGRLLHADS